MAYETELGNIAHPTNIVSQGISDALVQAVVAAPLIYSEDLPDLTTVKLFRKKGSLSAEEVGESSELGIDGAGQEYTETTVTATAVKLAAGCIVTVEAQRFSPITMDDIAREVGMALARDWDDEIMAALDDGTNYVACDSVCVPEKVLEAVYTVRRYTSGLSSGQLRGILNYKAVFELQKYLLQSGASVFSQNGMTSLLTGVTGKNGYVGTLPGVDLFCSDGVPTSSSDDVGCVFDPAIAFASMVSPSPIINARWLGSGDGTRGFADEITGYIFCDVVCWNDYATCEVRSDT